MAFLKQASLKIEQPDISVNNWVGNRGNVKTAANKMVEYKKIIADFSPENYLLTHCTIVASVDVEDAGKAVHFVSEKTKSQYPEIVGRRDFFITPQTSKYMNANGDAWSRDLLKKSYRTFIGAENYVEHVQDPALSKGKILDAVAREVDDNKSIFIDILVATNKKHTDIVNKIKTGTLQTLSMGAVVAFTICSQCGRVASDDTELCSHVKFLKKNHFISDNDGKKRITAELCGHFLYPESNKFIEGSWVETPAFKGAVLRNEVNVDNIDKIGFDANIDEAILNSLNISDLGLAKTASQIMNAFKLVDNITKSFKKAKTEDTEEAPEIEEVKDVPIEEPSEDVDLDKDTEEEGAPDEETEEAPEDTEEETEEAPEDDKEAPKKDEKNKKEESPEDFPIEDIPDDASMGEPPKKEKEEKKLEEESKKPYEVLKQEIKEQLKDQIKKELLKDLGISFEEPIKPSAPTLQNINLNDTLVKSSLNTIKSACIIAKKVGLKNITNYGFSQQHIVKIAELSKKYSINKEIFRAVESMEHYDFATFRRFAKEVESKIGRELEMEERLELDRLAKDILLK